MDEKVLTSRFIVDWNDKNVRLDKDSGLYDKKAEKKFEQKQQLVSCQLIDGW